MRTVLAKQAIVFLAFLAAGCSSAANTPVKQCATQETCLNDPQCFCWCSQICNFRKKTAEDHPVFVENDPNGKSCYCKQWDLDHYEDNCILKKGIKEPPGAQ